MIKTLLIDDEMHCLDTLHMLLSDYCPEVSVLEQCVSSKKALSAIQLHEPELIFLDIEMPGMNGFELLEQFSTIPFAVIFTTSYNQYAIRAIRFSALDYLLKPIDPKELVAAVHKVESQKRLPSPEQFQLLKTQMSRSENKLSRLAIPTIDGFELIRAEEVVRLEADDNYTRLFLKNNIKLIACRTMKEMEEQLLDFGFFVRVHHSYIVNLNEVTRYVRGEGGYLVMTDGSTVSVSRSRKELLLKKLIPGRE